MYEKFWRQKIQQLKFSSLLIREARLTEHNEGPRLTPRYLIDVLMYTMEGVLGFLIWVHVMQRGVSLSVHTHDVLESPVGSKPIENAKTLAAPENGLVGHHGDQLIASLRPPLQDSTVVSRASRGRPCIGTHYAQTLYKYKFFRLGKTHLKKNFLIKTLALPSWRPRHWGPHRPGPSPRHRPSHWCRWRLNH